MTSSDTKKRGMQILAWSLFSTVLLLPSCKETEVEPLKVVASYQVDHDPTNFLKVTFTNFSENATTNAWDFGDSETSSEKDPDHIYTSAGTYTVKLTASDASGQSAVSSKEVVITDPLAAQRALIGDNGKVWQLLADVSTGVYPYMIVPAARDDIWWAFGGQHDWDDLCVRECVFDDTWTFNTDGTFTFENNGYFWADAGVWPDELVGCFDATLPANWVGKDGVTDLSPWNSGTHNFVYDPLAETITTNSLGGFIGLAKVGSTAEVTEPQTTVEYNVVKLIDEVNGVDTLVVETNLIDGSGVLYGYWSSTLVSYDNPAEKIVIDVCPATADFSYIIDGKEVTFTNASTSATSYSWDFGDGSPLSTEENPVHLYDADGTYSVTLTVNGDVSATISKDIEIGAPLLTVVNIDFEDDAPFFDNLFGGSGWQVIANPDASGINVSTKVGELVHGDQTWAGVGGKLEGYLGFEGKTVFTVMVKAPVIGTFTFKMENSADTNTKTELNINITEANVWTKLTFPIADFTLDSGIANGIYDTIVIFPGFGTTAADTYYVDNIVLE